MLKGNFCNSTKEVKSQMEKAEVSGSLQNNLVSSASCALSGHTTCRPSQTGKTDAISSYWFITV
jgi:hypothetical protein